MKRSKNVRIILPKMREHLSEKKEVLFSDKLNNWADRAAKTLFTFMCVCFLSHFLM
jgi:hypothetical protein